MSRNREISLNKWEMLMVFRSALIALSDGEVFDRMVKEMKIEDPEVLRATRGKIEFFLAGTKGELTEKNVTRHMIFDIQKESGGNDADRQLEEGRCGRDPEEGGGAKEGEPGD